MFSKVDRKAIARTTKFYPDYDWVYFSASDRCIDERCKNRVADLSTSTELRIIIKRLYGSIYLTSSSEFFLFEKVSMEMKQAIDYKTHSHLAQQQTHFDIVCRIKCDSILLKMVSTLENRTNVTNSTASTLINTEYSNYFAISGHSPNFNFENKPFQTVIIKSIANFTSVDLQWHFMI